VQVVKQTLTQTKVVMEEVLEVLEATMVVNSTADKAVAEPVDIQAMEPTAWQVDSINTIGTTQKHPQVDQHQEAMEVAVSHHQVLAVVV
jgi:hypothetical protein